MAYDIPLPGQPIDSFLKGVSTGSDLYTRIMDPILQREKNAEARRQFDEAKRQFDASLGFKTFSSQREFDEAKRQFDASLGLKTAEFQREDPINKFNRLMQVASMFQNPSQGIPQQGMGPITRGPNGVFAGLPNTEGLQKPPINLPLQNANEVRSPVDMGNAETGQRGLDMKALIQASRQNPFLRGFLKESFHVDPTESGLTGPAREAESLESLRLQYGEDSPVYKNAKSQYESTLESRQDLRDLRERTKKGLQPGETEFFDEKTGMPLGKKVPLTEKERASEQANISFNYTYPFISQGAAPFSGPGSIERLENAALHYKTDPKAKNAFENMMLADKLLTPTTASEMNALALGRTNLSFKRLEDTLKVNDVPKIIKRLIKEYQIPAEANQRVAERYRQIISESRKRAIEQTPAHRKYFYDPERQAQYQGTQGFSVAPTVALEDEKKTEKKKGSDEIVTFNRLTGRLE